MTKIEELAASSGALVLSRLTMLITPLLFGAVTYYYVQTTTAQEQALRINVEHTRELQTWRQVTDARLAREERGQTEFQAEVRAKLQMITATNEQVAVALERLTVTLTMMRSPSSLPQTRNSAAVE